MAYTRGSSSDFDRFAKVTGEPSWSWARLQPYIHKVLFFDMGSFAHARLNPFR
jgi:choline dehydrogenase-like flavoprotein